MRAACVRHLHRVATYTTTGTCYQQALASSYPEKIQRPERSQCRHRQRRKGLRSAVFCMPIDSFSPTQTASYILYWQLPRLYIPGLNKNTPPSRYNRAGGVFLVRLHVYVALLCSYHLWIKGHCSPGAGEQYGTSGAINDDTLGEASPVCSSLSTVACFVGNCY